MADDQNEPVRLEEDAETGDRFLVYGTDKGLMIDIRYEGETLWMSQMQMATLFGVTRQNVNSHLSTIYNDGELDRAATSKEILQVRTEGGRSVSRNTLIHNLDAIIAVGYRVSTKQGTLFRRWATGVLVQFAKKGFVVDTRRLKNPENADRVAELREIIRDIRSDEANLYRELRQICSMCQDYDPSTGAAREFYQRVQAKLVYAVTSHTPAEIVAGRANCQVDNMGLQTWPNDNIRKSDVATSKNYLFEPEIKELNRLTSILLDIFEDQLNIGRLVTMDDARKFLDTQLKGLGRVVLTGGGSIRTDEAKARAEREYDKFNQRRTLGRRQEADQRISDLAAEAKKLPKTPRR